MTKIFITLMNIQILLNVCLLNSSLLFGQTQDELIDQSFRYLLHLNHASLIEPGGSHGSYGTKLGVGMQKLPAMGSDNQFLMQTIDSKSGYERSANAQRITIIRGTSLPVDLGLNVAMLSHSPAMPINAIIQITIVEGLGWPSLSARYNYATTLRLRNTSINEQSLSLVASKSISGWIKPFVSASLSKFHIRTTGEIAERFGLLDAASDQYLKDGWYHVASAGLKLILDGTFDLVGEYQIDQHSQYSYAAKLSVLL